MQNVYTKRGIKLKFVAQLYGNENPKVDVYYDDPVHGCRQTLATDVEITATDANSPQVVTVTPVTKGGDQWVTIVFKNDHYDEDGDRNVQLVGVDLDSNNDVTPESHTSWVWSEYNFDGVEVTNENTVFDYITITHTAEFKLKFDMEEIEMMGYSDEEIKASLSPSNIIRFGELMTISTNKADNRLIVNGVESTDYVLSATEIDLENIGAASDSNNVEFVCINGVTWA